MKKATLILIAFAAMTTAALGQDKKEAATPPVQHPGYVPDASKPVTVTFTLTIGHINDYFVVQQQGGVQAMASSDKLTGKQITDLMKAYDAVVDSVNRSLVRSYNSFIKADQARFTADTLKLYHKGGKP